MSQILARNHTNQQFFMILSYCLCHLQVSVGTLLAFTMVAISVLILRYVPPDKVPLPSSHQDSFASHSLQFGKSIEDATRKDPEVMVGSSKDSTQPLLDQVDISVEIPLMSKRLKLGNCRSSIHSPFSLHGFVMLCI